MVSFSFNSSSSLIIVYFYSLLLIVSVMLCVEDDYKNRVGAAAVPLPNNETVPAVLVFGDSIVDPGNNNQINTLIKCNFPPYGRDFMGGRSTGRFCNGKVPSDYIAESFGVKELLPAYLDPSLQLQDLITGVSFASGGTGYDPLTPKVVSVLSLSDQLEMFKEYIEKLKEGVGAERTATILAKSIYIVCAGSDDLANTYFSTQYRSSHYDIAAYTDLMLSYASDFLQALYGLGARKVGVFSAPPIGCVPSQRTLGGGIGRVCVEQRNQAALLFNSKLSPALTALQRKLPDSRIVYLDIYTPLNALIQDPAKNGFEVNNKGCCGTGIIEVTLLCNPYTLGTCADVSKYIFWDSFHPTERTYSILVPEVFNKYAKDFF